MKKSPTMSSAVKVVVVGLILGCSPVMGPVSALAQEDAPKVRLWDTGKIYLEKNPRLAVFKDRGNWKQMPYGTTGHRKHADSDLIIEGDTFYLFLFGNKQDGPDLLPKRGKGVGKPCELYKVHQNSTGIRNFGYGTRSGRVNILKNTAKEIVVEHTGLGHIASQSIVTTYRAVAGRPWLEVKPVVLANQQGMYSKSRICAYVRQNGDDLVMDSMRAPYREDLKLPA
ncbi:MAG: hypothetical protein KAV00_03140, partial [Phycisphaerae bacterium]|nr:hypothetical protein [Phycisphaerae bacterium]